MKAGTKPSGIDSNSFSAARPNRPCTWSLRTIHRQSREVCYRYRSSKCHWLWTKKLAVSTNHKREPSVPTYTCSQTPCHGQSLGSTRKESGRPRWWISTWINGSPISTRLLSVQTSWPRISSSMKSWLASKWVKSHLLSVTKQISLVYSTGQPPVTCPWAHHSCKAGLGIDPFSNLNERPQGGFSCFRNSK